MTTTDVPVAIYPQTTHQGTPWVETVITGPAAITLATAITRRLHGNHLARSASHPSLVALIAGAITDTGITLTPDQARDLADTLTEAAAYDTPVDYWPTQAGA